MAGAMHKTDVQALKYNRSIKRLYIRFARSEWGSS